MHRAAIHLAVRKHGRVSGYSRLLTHNTFDVRLLAVLALVAFCVAVSAGKPAFAFEARLVGLLAPHPSTPSCSPRR